MDPRLVAQRAMMEREQYVRCVALLVKAIETQPDDAMLHVDGKLCLRKTAFDDVPKKYRVDLRPAQVKVSEDPNATPEDVIVLDVTDVGERPVLQVANGLSKGGIAIP